MYEDGNIDIIHIKRRGDRAAECTGFENRRGATHRGFESPPLRLRLAEVPQGRKWDSWVSI